MTLLKLLYTKKHKLPQTKCGLTFKTIQKLGFIIVCAVFLSGCNFLPSQTPNQDVINTIDDGSIQGNDASNIIVWGLFENNENLDPLFSRFENEINEESTEQIEVVYVQKDKEDYVVELDQALNDNDPNTSPDVYMIHSSWIQKYVDNISNIPSNILNADYVENNFHTFLSSSLINNNQVQGVPLWVDLLALVYNKDHLLQDAGATVISEDWNQFLLQAQNMTKYDDAGKITRAGFAAGGSENIEFSAEFLDLLFLQARTKPIAQDKLNVPYSSSEIEQVENALDWYKGFTDGENKTWSEDLKLDTALFIEGKLSAAVLPSWRVLDILNYKKQYNLDLDIGVSKMPQLDPSSTDKVYYPSYWIYVVSSDSPNSNNSYKLLEFITRKAEQEFYIQTVKNNDRELAMLSPLKTVATDQSAESEYLKPYFDSTLSAVNWKMPDGELVKAEYVKLLNDETTLENLLTFINNLE